MLTKERSESAIEVVNRRDVAGGAAAGDISAWTSGSDVAEEKLPPLGTAAKFWSSVLGLCMEGFALCGASMHPLAYLPVAPDLDEDDIGGSGATEFSNWREIERRAVDEEWLPAAERGGQGRRGGPLIIFDGETSHARKHRIENAVAALEKLDDLTLHSLGILDRSQIERTVRFCHDC
jgi:hypothetical protein